MSPERKAELLQLAESRGMFLLYGPPRLVDYGDVLKVERSTEPTPATMAMLEFAEAAVQIERDRADALQIAVYQALNALDDGQAIGAANVLREAMRNARQQPRESA